MFKRLITIWHFITATLAAGMVVSFLLYLGLNPIDVGKFLSAKISHAVNTDSTASVPENPFNVLALQLKEKEIRLNEREQSLTELEDKIIGETGSIKQWLAFIIPLVVALFILIAINFYFDYKEKKILEKIEEDEKKIIEAEKRLEEKLEEKR